MGMLTKSYLFRLTAEQALKDTWINKTTKAKMSNDKANNTMAQLNNYEVTHVICRLPTISSP